jgi:hypothetical protein
MQMTKPNYPQVTSRISEDTEQTLRALSDAIEATRSKVAAMVLETALASPETIEALRQRLLSESSMTRHPSSTPAERSKAIKQLLKTAEAIKHEAELLRQQVEA